MRIAGRSACTTSRGGLRRRHGWPAHAASLRCAPMSMWGRGSSCAPSRRSSTYARLVSENARAVMGLERNAIAPGATADANAVRGTSLGQVLATTTEDRVVIRAGALAERTSVARVDPTRSPAGRFRDPRRERSDEHRGPSDACHAPTVGHRLRDRLQAERRVRLRERRASTVPELAAAGAPTGPAAWRL